MDVDYLREALRADAQLAGEPEPDLYERVRAHRQRSDRRRLSALAAGLAALLVAVAVPVSLTAVQRSDESGQVANPSGIDGFLGLPTRGSLADDTDFLEGVRHLPWGGPPDGEPPVQSRHVVFASDIYGQRWALIAGTLDDGTVTTIWFFGPEGADADELAAGTAISAVTPEMPLTAVHADNPGLALVVVTAPGDVVEISRRVEIDSTGSISRTYEPLDNVDGIVITTIDAISGGIGVSVQVTRDGRRLFRGDPIIQSGGVGPPPCSAACGFEAPTLDSIDFDDPRGMAALVPDPHYIASGFASLAAPIARPINDLAPALLFAGSVPATPGWEATAIVVAITLPSGATAVNSTVIESQIDQDGAILSVAGAMYVQPAGLLDIAGLALRVPSPNRGPASAATPRSLMILAPAPYTGARPLGLRDAQAGPNIALDDGVAVIPDLGSTIQFELVTPSGDTVRTVIGDGEVSWYADNGPGYTD